MADQITQFRIGVPGADGAGVTAAEKNSYFQKTGGTITGQTIFDLDGTPAVQIRKADDTSLVFVDTVNSRFRLVNGMDLQGYSDNMSTETWSIDGATGAAQFDGSVTVGGSIIGESIWLPFWFDNGASVLSVGTYVMAKVPYDATISSDANRVGGAAVWDVWVDGGTIGFDIWYGTYAQLPLSSSQRISGTLGSNNPRVTSGGKGTSSSLTNWSTALVGGNFILARIDSVATATKAALGIHIVKA